MRPLDDDFSPQHDRRQEQIQAMQDYARERFQQVAERKAPQKVLQEQLAELYGLSLEDVRLPRAEIAAELQELKRRNFALEKKLQQQQKDIQAVKSDGRLGDCLRDSAQRVSEYQSEIRRLNELLVAQKAQIKDLEVQNAGLSAQNADLKNLAASQQSSTTADSEDKLAAANRQISAAKQEIEQLQTELRRAAQRFQHSQQLYQQGGELFAQLGQKQSDLHAVAQNAAAAINQNANRVEEALTELGKIRSFNTSLEVSQRHMEMRVKQFLESQSAQQGQTLQNLNTQVSKYKQLIQTYENDQLAQQQNLNKCKLVITQQQGKIEQLINQLDRANEEAKAAQEAMQKLRLEGNNLVQQLHELQFQQQNAETLQVNNADLTEQVKQFNARLADSRQEREREQKAHALALQELNNEIQQLKDANAALLEDKGNGDYSQLYAGMKENYEQLKRGTDEIIQQYHEKLQQIKGQHEKERQLNTALKYKQRQMEAELVSFQQKCEQLQQSYQEHSQISAATQNEKSEMDYQRRYQIIYQMMERQHQLIQKQQAELQALKTASGAFPQQVADLKARLQVAMQQTQNDMLVINELQAELARVKQSNQIYADKCAEIQAKMQNQQAEQSGQNYYIEQLQQSIEVLQSEKADIIKQLRLFQSQRDGARTADEIIQEANQLLKSAMAQ